MNEFCSFLGSPPLYRLLIAKLKSVIPPNSDFKSLGLNIIAYATFLVKFPKIFKLEFATLLLYLWFTHFLYVISIFFLPF